MPTSGKTSTETIPAPISDAPTSLAIAPRSMPMSTIATISGRPVAPKRARLERPRAGSSSRSHRSADDAADDEQQAEEERRQQQAVAREEAVEVEVHPGHDEVDRDQEAEADPLEPHADDLAVRRVEHEADDQPGGERAEHEVEADVVREPDERGEHEHRQPHRRLAGRVDRCRAGSRRTRGGRARSADRGAAGDDERRTRRAGSPRSPRRRRRSGRPR